MNKLAGKTTVITGSNSGIGFATAKEFARQGAKVVISGRDQKTLDEAVREIGGEILAVRADVSKLADIDRLSAETKKRFGILPVFVLLLAGCSMNTSSNNVEEPADLIITNGRIVTQDERGTIAQAAAVKGGRFIVVGSNEEVSRRRGVDTRVIDLKGRTVIPGLNDSHLHPTRGGRFYNAELRWDGVPTLRRAVQMVREQAAHTPQGQWVRVVGGWSPYQFEERRMPTLDELNEAAPNTPVYVLYLYSRGFLNRAGLKALGIDRNTVAPPGGRFEKDADGEPTGLLIAAPNPRILYETIAKLPPLLPEDQVNSSLHFYRELNRFGLTSVIDAAGGGHGFPDDYAASKQLAEQGKLSLRISYFLFPQKPGEELADFQRWTSEARQNQNEDRLRPDGYVLEGGGEALVAAAVDFENFMEAPPQLDPKFKEPLKLVVDLLVKNRYPFRIHASYDDSISQLLDVFEAVNKDTPFDGLRWTLDHAETISPRNMDRVKALGGGIAVQSRLAYAGEDFKARYPQQAASAPPIREMMKRGIPVGAGTDGTRVASYNPWISLYWLVTGKTVGGTQLASTDNRLSREEALRLYTVGSAWFSGEETLKGRIAPGQYADFAVLSADYFAVSEEEIKRIESVLTVVGGDVVYGVSDFASLASPLPPTSPAWSPVSTYGGYYKTTK